MESFMHEECKGFVSWSLGMQCKSYVFFHIKDNLIQFFKLKNNSKIHNFHTIGLNATKQSPCPLPCGEISKGSKNATMGLMVF